MNGKIPDSSTAEGCSNDTVWDLNVDYTFQLGHMVLCLVFHPGPCDGGGHTAGSRQAPFSKNSLTPNGKTCRSHGGLGT